MVSHDSAKFGDHRYCGSGDITFLVAEEENSKCSRFNPLLLFNPPLLFISKGHDWKHTAYHIINSDPGHTRPMQQLDKTLKITFASLSRKSDEKEKKKKRLECNAKLFAFHANAISSLDRLQKKSLEHNDCLYAASVLERRVRKPLKGQRLQSIKLVTNKLSKCYSNGFKKYLNNTGTNYLNIILQTRDMFFAHWINWDSHFLRD